MGIVRGLAHSVVLEVTDAVMFADILRQLMDLDGFYWLRTIRKQARSIYAPGSTFTIGKGNVLREGDDITLIANGIMVAEALEAARQLEQEGVSAAVIDMFTLKPIDRMLVKNYAEKRGVSSRVKTTASIMDWGQRWRKCWWKTARCRCAVLASKSVMGR